MTTISATMIEDSISPHGIRLPTMHLRYPRFIHAESKTHRLLSESGETIIEELTTPGFMNDPNLSRNARSSRAVPINKMIEEISNDPVIPIHWGAAQPGMQAFQECENPVVLYGHQNTARDTWLWARDHAVDAAKAFHAAGYAKQVVNRLLEPFMHIDTLVTGTEWKNFFALRDHEAAEPHMRALAQAIKACMAESTPRYVSYLEMHLPYVTALEREIYRHEVLVKISVARCARISYAPFDGDSSIEAELKRYNLLVGSLPMHASPAEHIATPDYLDVNNGWLQQELHGNLCGWIQHRKTLAGERGEI